MITRQTGRTRTGIPKAGVGRPALGGGSQQCNRAAVVGWSRQPAPVCGQADGNGRSNDINVLTGSGRCGSGPAMSVVVKKSLYELTPVLGRDPATKSDIAAPKWFEIR